MPRSSGPGCVCCGFRRWPQIGAIIEIDQASFVAANMPHELAVALHGKKTVGKWTFHLRFMFITLFRVPGYDCNLSRSHSRVWHYLKSFDCDYPRHSTMPVTIAASQKWVKIDNVGLKNLVMGSDCLCCDDLHGVGSYEVEKGLWRPLEVAQ